MRYDKVPIDFGMALARNPVALNAYSAMTPEQKDAILDRAWEASSEKEMYEIVNAIGNRYY